MLTPTVDRILEALKATVTELWRWRTHRNVADPISYSVADPHVMGSYVIHYVGDPQMIYMKATNSPVSYGCLTVGRE